MEVATEKSTSNLVPEGYKRTEVGVIPEEWEVKKIGNFLTFKNGLNKAKKYFGAGTPIVNYMDVFKHSGLLKKDLEGKVTLSKKEIRRYEVKKGDVFFTRTSETVEEVGISAVMLEDVEDTVYSGFVLRGRPTNSVTDLYFRKYCFDSEIVRSQIQSSATHTTRALTNGGSLSKVQLPLPPTLEEQQAIAGALSDVDALIAELDALIEKKQQVKKGAMQQLLTPPGAGQASKKRLPGFDGEWEEKKLGDLLTVMHGKSQKSVASESGEYPILGTSGQIGKATSYLYDKPSVLIGRKGTIDRPQYMEEPFWTIDTLFYTQVNERAIAKFLYYRFLLIDWTSYNEASGVPSLNSSTIENIEILFPPELEEQESIVNILSDMDAEIRALKSKRAKYEKIKQGMMQELLTGKTRLVKEGDSQFADSQSKPNHNWEFDEAVLVSVLADRFGTKEFPLGRFRRTKYSYLVRRYLESNVDQFLKKAAGPYNPQTRYSGPETIALNNGYVQNWRNKKRTGFIADENIEQAWTYFENWYGQQAIDWLESRFRYAKNKELELITTVDKARIELEEESREVTLSTVKEVIESHPEWQPKLERDLFSDKKIEEGIKESFELFGK